MTDDNKSSVFDASSVTDTSSNIQNVDQCIAVYKAALEKGDIQKAYGYLLRYVMHLKAHFINTLADRFSFGNISPGYMDFTYFPFSDGDLRARKLRFGIVLNHQALRFELWLMGQKCGCSENVLGQA